MALGEALDDVGVGGWGPQYRSSVEEGRHCQLLANMPPIGQAQPKARGQDSLFGVVPKG